MNHAILTERISATIAAGNLPRQLSYGWANAAFAVSDLLKPWGKLYPGLTPEQIDAYRTEPFGYKSALCRPGRLQASPRRSLRPLPLPRRVGASPQLLRPSLLDSIRGIWDYYKANNLADKHLLRRQLDEVAIQDFIAPLLNICSDFHPLEIELDNLHIGKNIASLQGLYLYIPCETYEDEAAGVIQGFLEGVSGVRWLLENYFGGEMADYGSSLPKQDHKLITDHGFENIVQTYADYQGPKTVDIHKLGNFADTYFGKVQLDYPELWDHDFDIISGDGGSNNSLLISSKKDIDFALAYCDAYFDMMGGIPHPWNFQENEGNQFDEFVHELCDTWRVANGKRKVKWTNPSHNTLSHRIKTGEL